MFLYNSARTEGQRKKQRSGIGQDKQKQFLYFKLIFIMIYRILRLAICLNENELNLHIISFIWAFSLRLQLK